MRRQFWFMAGAAALATWIFRRGKRTDDRPPGKLIDALAGDGGHASRGRRGGATENMLDAFGLGW
jgi:hypothetical protein